MTPDFLCPPSVCVAGTHGRVHVLYTAPFSHFLRVFAVQLVVQTSSPVSNAVPGIQTELYNNRQEIAEKEMPAKLCQHEQDKTILALGPGLFDQSIFCYLPRKKAEESNVILHII